MTIMINASLLTGLANNDFFISLKKFILELDSLNLDNLVMEVLEDIEPEHYAYFFNYLTRVYYYIKKLINSQVPNVEDFKILNTYITKEKALLKVEITEF